MPAEHGERTMAQEPGDRDELESGDEGDRLDTQEAWQGGTGMTQRSSWQDPTSIPNHDDAGGTSGAGMSNDANQQPDRDREEFRRRSM
jgi:hypothetical protein